MPQYWYMIEALVALGRHQRSAATTFTRADLIAWSEKLKDRRTAAQMALDHLALSGLVRRVTRSEGAPPVKQGSWCYRLTTEGMAAAKEAYKAWKHQALSAAGAKASRPRSSVSFGSRLWALFRMRKTLSPAEAAATLVDAGANVARATNTASQYLRRWSQMHPEAIQVSKQRATKGAFRFVLVQDLGPVPPVTTAPKKAQGGAVA